MRNSSAPKAAGVFAGAVMHTPVEVSERAVEMASRLHADVVVAIGGGSTTGLGKAIALRTSLPQIVLPTTYAGSEMTPILGETENGLKKTQTTPKVLPQVVIYDVEQTMSLPTGLSGTSGINAIAHAVEALYARDRNPVTSTLALAAVKALASALPKIASDPADRDARYDALYGAWLCASVSARSGWRCTTSSATRWAAVSTSHMQKPTPSSCRTRLPITRRPYRTPWTHC